MQMRKDDLVEQCYFASTHHKLLCFSNRGKVYLLNIYEVPEASRQSRGVAMVNLLPLEKKSILPLPYRSANTAKTATWLR